MDLKYNVIITPLAEKDLESILDYISSELKNVSAAQNFYDKLFELIDKLRSVPNMGSNVDNEFVKHKGIKKLIVDNYVLYYTLPNEKNVIHILRISYGKRDLLNILKELV